MLKSVSGADLLHIPFNVSAPSLTALIGGQVQVAVDTVVASAPFVKSGKIKAIAVLSPTRPSLLPNVPTVSESGYPGFDMSTWCALDGTGQSVGPHPHPAGSGIGQRDGRPETTQEAQ